MVREKESEIVCERVVVSVSEYTFTLIKQW
jgi:hypothetical protein